MRDPSIPRDVDIAEQACRVSAAGLPAGEDLGQEHEQDHDFSAHLRRHATRHRAGAALREAVRAQSIEGEASHAMHPAGQDASVAPGPVLNFRPPPRSGASSLAWALGGMAAGALLTLALISLRPDALPGPMWSSLWTPDAASISSPRPPSSNVAGLVADHLRSLMDDHLFDIASSEQHTVKPWFQGRLDFSPPVIDLRDEGFPLVGGRLDVVEGRPAAALVYRRRAHTINLFVWPSTATAPQMNGTVNGYHVIEWSGQALRFAAVSDLAQAELAQFAAHISTGLAGE